MTRLSYPVKEAFLTLQGEGAHAGRRAVFVRFAGCNVWSGREEHRARDTAKGCCAAWCDTAFVGTDGVNGGTYSAVQLVGVARELWGTYGRRTVVFTGGEPSLVLDRALVDEFHDAGFLVHVETNGSKELPRGCDWVTLSPKPPMEVVHQQYDEVKVVYPVIDPVPWEAYAPMHFVQPLDEANENHREANVRDAIDFVMKHPRWRLGAQNHKSWGLP